MIRDFFIKWIISRVLKRFAHLRDVHRYAFKRYADRVALITPTGIFTYREIEQRALALVSLFVEKKIARGDSIFALVKDDHEQFEIKIACTDAGVVLSAFHSAHSAEQIVEAAKSIMPKLLIYDQNIAKGLIQQLTVLFPQMLFIDVGENGNYKRVLAKLKSAYSSNPVDQDMPVALGFTSGTTGKPKTLITTSKTNLASLRLLIKNLKLSTQRRNIMLLGIPVIGAGSGVFLPMWLSGGCIVIPENYSIEKMLPLIEEHSVTHSFMTPSLLIDLLDDPKRKLTDIRSLTTIIYGTAPMAAEKLKECILQMGAIFQQGYGMAEVLPPVSLLQKHQHVNNLGEPVDCKILSSVGLVVDGVEVKIINSGGTEIGSGEVGEIIIRSPTVFEGYWRQPELSSKIIRSGFLHTGDYGFLDKNNYLHLLDRKADIIVRNNQTIFPRMVEEIVHRCPVVKEAILIEVNDNLVLNISIRFCFREHNKSELVDMLRTYLAGELEASEVPEIILIQNELPRSFLGKLIRTQIRQSILESDKSTREESSGG